MTRYARRQLYSLLIAAFFWACATTAFIVIPVSSGEGEPVYKEIRIQLAPLEEKQPAPEPVKLPEPVIEEIAVAEPAPTPVPAVETPAPTPAPAAAAAPKAAEPAPAAAPVKAAEQVQQSTYQPVVRQSIEDMMTAQNANKKQLTQEEIEARFAAMEGGKPDATSPVDPADSNFKPVEGSGVSGTAGNSGSDFSGQAQSDSGKSNDATVSSETQERLESLKNTTGNRGSGNSPSSTVKGVLGVPGGTGSISSGSDGSGIEWADGRIRAARTAIDIPLSDAQKALIPTSFPDIRITFTVLPDGTVKSKSVQIENGLALPSEIRQAIEWYVSAWQFEIGTSEVEASINYSILKQ